MTEPLPLALVELAQRSSVGRVRDHNEDRSLATPALVAVADGMGGARAGEVAAEMAIERLTALPGSAGAEAVRGAIEDANLAIRAAADGDPDKAGMGTTVTAATVRGDRLDVVHVGDSRAYVSRGGELFQVTEDHSVVWELVKRGTITREEARTHPHRNVITRAVGAEQQVLVDIVDGPLEADDVLLLCSDGLTAHLDDAAIAALLAQRRPLEETADRLVEAANAAGGLDNITVVLARVGRGGGEAATPDTEGGEERGQTREMRVLGGVRGHAGSERHTTLESGRPLRVLEPIGRRRRSRLRPAVVAAVVVLALIVGGVAWVGSRTYVVEAGPGGEVRVLHGLPVSLAGLDLAVPWQDTGVPSEAVRGDEPGALRRRARGQGEAVELAARLVWRYRLPDLTGGNGDPPAGPIP